MAGIPTKKLILPPVWLVTLLLVYVGPPAAVANWMYLGMVSVSSNHQSDQLSDQPAASTPEEHAETVCASLPGLVARQIQVCRNFPSTISSVSDGARRGIRECQYQFRNERWNCSTLPDREDVFGATLERGSRETAFVYAVTSAGVVHAVTQACSSGNLTECTCDMSKVGKTTPEGWKWGGCSDDVRFGTRFARQFVDAPERIKHRKSQNVRSLMNLHNNEAGRQAVGRLMRMQCRCHGVSGSCELKTCWRSMPSFSSVGDQLKRRYQRSVELGMKRLRRLKRKSVAKRSLPVKRDQLVHIHKSPNYCVMDEKRGIFGTTGRICSKKSSGADGCRLLCCGRGYNTQIVRRAERCHCKFVWCCSVRCKTCISNIEIHTCK